MTRRMEAEIRRLRMEIIGLTKIPDGKIAILEAENAALKDDLQESEEACEHYASDWNGACTENDALKAELAMEKTQAEQFMHDAFNQKVRAENVEAQVEQQTSLLESCRKALVKVKARVAVYEKHFGVLKEAPR
jgi:chromosome segregation ATPase